MAVNVATLTAKLVADTKGLKSGLRSAKGDVGKFGKQTEATTKKGAKGFGSMKTAALGFGAALGAGAALKFAKDSIDAFSNLEESVNAVNVVYGDAAQGVHDLGVDSADAFGLSTRALNDAAVGLGAFVDKIDASDPANAFENIIGRAGDFASVMNITTEDALEKFRSGLSGEAEPLKQFGINLSAAEVEAVALREGIIGVGEKMDEGQKIQARYKAIMEQTEKTAGDFAATSDGLAGSQKKLSAKWEEAQAVLGEKLAPVMTRILQAGVDLIPVFVAVAGEVGDLADDMMPLVDTVADLAGLLGELTGSTDAAGESGGVFQTVLGGVKDIAEDVFNPLGNVGMAVGDMREAFGLVEDEATPASEALDAWAAAADGVKNKADLAVGATSELNDKMGLQPDIIADIMPAAKTYTDEALAGMAKAAADAKKEHDELKGAVTGVRTALRRLTDPVFNATKAIEAYDLAVEAFHDDGGTQEEFDAMTDAMIEMESAQAAVGKDNLEAYGLAAEKAGARVGLLGDEIGEFVVGNAAIGTELIDSLDDFRAGLEEIADKRIQVEIRASLPSDADLDDAIQDAISRASRRGDFVFAD